MNLIQVIPQPSSFNTRFTEALLDYGSTGEIGAVYDAGGPRFWVVASGNMCELRTRHQFQPGGARRELVHTSVEKLRQAIADHLAIINPIDND